MIANLSFSSPERIESRIDTWHAFDIINASSKFGPRHTIKLIELINFADVTSMCYNHGYNRWVGRRLLAGSSGRASTAKIGIIERAPGGRAGERMPGGAMPPKRKWVPASKAVDASDTVTRPDNASAGGTNSTNVEVRPANVKFSV